MSLPPEDAITRPWWDATRARRLVLQACAACGRLQHPPRAVCTACAGAALVWREASGEGTIDAFTVVARRIRPELEPPYAVARVRLAEGPLLLSNIVESDLAALACDQAVRLAWRPLGDGRHLPVFRS